MLYAARDRKGNTMDYLLFIVERPDHFAGFTPQDWATLDQRHVDFVAAVAAQGASVVWGEKLAHPQPGDRVVLRTGGEVLVTDGPFAETAEVILGIYKVRVESEQQARQLAALCPTAGWVDIRRVDA